MEVGASNGDRGTLRRDLNDIGERVEEVAELTVVNSERFGSRQA